MAVMGPARIQEKGHVLCQHMGADSLAALLAP